MMTLILFLVVVYLAVWAGTHFSWATLIALVAAAAAFHYHRKWERAEHPERFKGWREDMFQ